VTEFTEADKTEYVESIVKNLKSLSYNIYDTEDRIRDAEAALQSERNTLDRLQGAEYDAKKLYFFITGKEYNEWE
jgi:hypothetical protein